MAVIKQRTIPTGTVKLKRLKNDTDLSPNKFKYVVELPDGDRVGLSFTKQEGLREFERVVSNRTRKRGGAMEFMSAMDRATEGIFRGGDRF